MLLEDRVAVVYGGGGAIGGAVARDFAREGAQVVVVGRTRTRLAQVVSDITAAGGRAEAAVVDASDEASVEEHAADVVRRLGSIDVTLNAVGIPHVQGPPLAELSLTDFTWPIIAYLRSNFLTAKAVSRHMQTRGSGVILTLSTPGSRLAGTGFLGYGVTCAAVEAFSRILSGELGSFGIRVISLRPQAIPESLPTSHVRAVFDSVATRGDTTVEAWLSALEGTAVLGRLPTLDQVASFASFAASDRAGAMTGAIANLSCGAIVD